MGNPVADPSRREVDDLLARALHRQRTGDLANTDELLREILRRQPGHAHATHLRAIVARCNGKPEVALELARRAVELGPTEAVYHDALGAALALCGRFAAAAAAHRRAIELQPGFAGAWSNLGILLRAGGNLTGAEEALRRASVLAPDHAGARHDLGLVLKERGHMEEALACFREAIRLDPTHTGAHNSLAVCLLSLDRIDEAVELLEHAAAALPENAEIQCNLGAALARMGDPPRAEAALRRALACGADLPAVRVNLARTLVEQDRLEDAATELRRAIAAEPGFAVAHARLGLVLYRQGCVSEAITAYERALASAPDWAEVRSNLLMALNCDPGSGEPRLREAHRNWNDRHARPLAPPTPAWPNQRDPDRRLRIGYLSADLREHPVGRLFEPLLRAHDRKEVEVFCYSNVDGDDATTRRLRRLADDWREIRPLDDESAAERIRDDRIDILVDLAGHTAHGRPLVLARKPAPLQLSSFGYRNPSGLETMDYHLTDPVRCPPGTRLPFPEEPLRLEGCSHCYEPPSLERPLGPPPRLLHGAITFGCFNTPSKLGAAVLATWARILSAVPGSRLRLQYAGLDDPGTRARLLERLAAQGVEAARIEIHGRSSFEDYLAAHDEVDVALDPFPFHGGITTCDALWMGVPAVTLVAPAHHGGLGPSLLTHAGFAELVAGSLDAYVALAVKLATDPLALDCGRAKVRERLVGSKLCDAASYARNVEAAYREVWRAWCRG